MLARSLPLALLCTCLLHLFTYTTTLAQQQVDHYETVVLASDNWTYWEGSSDPGVGWNLLGFNTGGWQQGPGGLGYGDGDDNTIVAMNVSLFIRREFTIQDISKIAVALFHIDYDDAFVAYLNGVEIARDNIGTVGVMPAWDEESDGEREAVMYQGGNPVEYIINPFVLKNLLKQGNNVLAIQIHNWSITSSDMTAIPFFTVGITDGSFTYNNPPNWFVAPQNLFLSSNLPLVFVDANGQTIPDEPGIDAEIGIVDNGPGVRNFLAQPFNDYEGPINIELRGQTSQSFPKKSYGFETIDNLGLDLDTNLLGYPKEEDWILYGPYSDKTLMRNALIMQLARDLGQYASRTRHCELFVDGVYQGVYVFMEKIKNKKGRVDIKNLNAFNTSGDALTGGYIFKIDKGNDPGWVSDFDVVNSPGNPIRFAYHYPRAENIVPAQEAYLKAFMDSFEYAIADPSYHYNGKRYSELIDINSFAENFLLNELGRNVDAYRLSSYFYKDRASVDNRLHAGPIWDFNLAFRNADYCNGSSTSGWIYLEFCDDGNPFWWANMLDDTLFTNQVNCRWNDLRSSGVISATRLHSLIDSMAYDLDEAQERNFTEWDILGQYVWPNPFPLPQDYPGEIQRLKDWVTQRIDWMDANMVGDCPACTAPNGLTVVGTTNTTADITWQTTPNKIWNIEYGPVGFAHGFGTTIKGVTTNAYTLTGIPQGAVYEVYVQDSCYKATSSWTGPVEFATASAGVIELAEAQGLRVLPNPSEGNLSVLLPVAFEGNVMVYNVLGEMVWVRQVATPVDRLSLDLGHLVRGVYWLKLGDGGKSVRLVLE